MPRIIFVLVCGIGITIFLAATSLALPQKSKSEDGIICEEGVEYMPHPNCSLYYACSNYVPIVRNCPGILYWNPSLNVCDHPVNVPECVGGTRPPIPEPSPSTPIPTTQGSPSEMPSEAPTEEPSHPTTERSTQEPSYPPSEIPTTERSTQEPTTAEPPVETTTQNKYPCPPEVPTIYMPHPEDCTAFYICRNGGFGGIFYCGTGLWFSSVRQGCVDPKDSDCVESQ